MNEKLKEKTIKMKDIVAPIVSDMFVYFPTCNVHAT